MNTSAIPNGGTAADRTITITDTTGTYRSTDGGRSFVGIDGEGRFNGAVVDGAMGIDNYGNYWHTNSWQPNEHIVDARTPEAQRHYERRREIEMRFGVTIAPADVSYSSPPASL